MKKTIFILFLLVSSFIYADFGRGGFGYMMRHGFFGGMGIFGYVLMILFWGVIIWLIYLFIKKTTNNKNSKSAFDILKERYTKGEITKEQFIQMKKDIL